MIEREGTVDGIVMSRDNRLQRVLVPVETMEKIQYAGDLRHMRGERITLIPVNGKDIIPVFDLLIEYEPEIDPNLQ